MKKKNAINTTQVGRNIRRWRKERGMTQQKLSVAASISTSSVCNAESGAFPLGQQSLARVAGALGVTVGDMYAGALNNRTFVYMTLVEPENSTPGVFNLVSRRKLSPDEVVAFFEKHLGLDRARDSIVPLEGATSIPYEN